MKRLARLFGTLLIVCLLLRAAHAAEPSFERDVRPILKTHCFMCHGEGSEREGNLDLRLRRLMAQGGDSGAAVVPGKPEESLIYRRVRDAEMPPGKKKLTNDEVSIIGRWIAAGAPTLRPEPEQIGPGHLITEEERSHWAFQPVNAAALPQVKHAELVRTPIDAFLLAKLEQHRLRFTSEADKETLIRRATLDLTGLPPTPEEVDQCACVAVSRLRDSGLQRRQASG
jgi:hypothetical protein